MVDFIVPTIPEETTLINSKKANEEAFYAAASSSENPIEDFFKIKTDLETTGQSSFIDNAKSSWEAEVDQSTKEAVIGVVNDDSISPEMKKAVLQNYAITKTIPVSLKDKYIEKTAVREVGTTIYDQDSQDFIIDTLAQRKKNNDVDINHEKIDAGSSSLLDITKGIGGVASSMLMSIPAGFLGVYELIKEQDSEKAAEVVAAIQQAGYMPEGDGAQHVMQSIAEKAAILGIPAQWLGNKALDITGSPLVATGVEVVGDPLNWVPFAAIKTIQKVKGAPKIVADAPLEAANVANPRVAENLAMATIVEPTGKAATAVGADAGTIIHDWSLPKVLPEEIKKSHPDLYENIINTVNANDNTIARVFKDSRYDPNVLEVTKREEEIGKIFTIINESRSPKYIQSMSLINEADGVFEGKAVYGRNNSYGFKRESDAQKAYLKLKESIDTLPEEFRGSLEIIKYDGQHYIQHSWKKEWDDISSKVFGKESIQTSHIFGLKTTELARSSLGRWVMPTGRFDKWVEHGGLRGIERAAYIKESLAKVIRDNISVTRQGKELTYLIDEAESRAVDYFSPKQISEMFPKMSTEEVNSLFATHTLWRRQQQYNYNFLNREIKNELVSKNMQGIYDHAGNYLGAGKVVDIESIGVKEAWDFETQRPINISKEILEKENKQLVRLNENIKGEGFVNQYAVIGGKTQLNLLPNEVLPKIPGYSGRRVVEPHYVDVIPTKLKIDGETVYDKKVLRSYSQTKAATASKEEGYQVAAQLLEEYPDHTIEVRPERQDSLGKVLTDYQIHKEMVAHSMKRGERLPSLDGKARIEDRLLTLINTTGALSRMGAFRAWDEAFQSAFTKGFSNFLDKGEFPKSALDIKPLPNMGENLSKEYKTAQSYFKYYERMKNNETTGDFVTTQISHSLADIAEKWKFPTAITDKLRGQKRNPLMAAKALSTLSYITYSIPRQHLIQPWQQMEFYALNPKTAAKNFQLTVALRTYLGANSEAISKVSKTVGLDVKNHLQTTAKKTADRVGEKEFEEMAEAIRTSGMLQSIDMNSIIHGVIHDADKALVENTPEQIWGAITALPKGTTRLARGIGFDMAELNNRVGNWLQTKDIWVAKNLGKSWKTKEAKEEIAAEALKISGAMNRGGALPYQEGMLSIFMQFAAISHKMLLNTFQDNATILTKGQRARLAALRLPMYGLKYGIPGGAIAYYFIEQSDNKELKDNAELFKRGAIDYSANALLGAFVEPDEKPDLAVSKILSPYSEGFLPYFETMWELVKWAKDDSPHPRYPAFGMMSSIGDAYTDIQGWMTTKDVNETNYKQIFMEAGEVASGFNSYAQGLAMLGMQGKVTKMGNKYGMEFTRQEAYAKMFFGINTTKEEDLWKLVQLERDVGKRNIEMGRTIYRQLENQRRKNNEEDYAIYVRKLNSFISVLDETHFSEQDKMEVLNEIEKLDKRNFTTIKESIMSWRLKHYQDVRTKEQQQMEDIYSRIPDKDIQKMNKAMKENNL